MVLEASSLSSIPQNTCLLQSSFFFQTVTTYACRFNNIVYLLLNAQDCIDICLCVLVLSLKIAFIRVIEIVACGSGLFIFTPVQLHVQCSTAMCLAVAKWESAALRCVPGSGIAGSQRVWSDDFRGQCQNMPFKGVYQLTLPPAISEAFSIEFELKHFHF